jgi:hypothetical protein
MQKLKQTMLFLLLFWFMYVFSHATVMPHSPIMSDNWEHIASFVAQPNNYCVSVAPVLTVKELNY